jgi:hypothetical protein
VGIVFGGLLADAIGKVAVRAKIDATSKERAAIEYNLFFLLFNFLFSPFVYVVWVCSF